MNFLPSGDPSDESRSDPSQSPPPESTATWRDVSEQINRRIEANSTEDDPSLSAPMLPPLNPDDDKLGKFRVVRVLGQGGQGTVLLVLDPDLGERALKLPTIGQPDAGLPSLLDDARKAAQLRHPNIVKIHETGYLIRFLEYFVMEHCEGGSLADWLRSTPSAPLPHRQAAAFLAPVAEAVAHGHAKNILHRDLKPGNILLRPRPGVADPKALGDFDPVVTDFGLAVAYDHATRRAETTQGRVEGTRAYMSPEQFAGDADRIDNRTDIYALGVIFYELLAGGRLYETRDPDALADAIRAGTWRRLRDRNPRVPAHVALVAERCLQFDPENRYPDATTLAADLRRIANDQLATFVAAPLAERTRRIVRRHPMLLGTLLLAPGLLFLPSLLRPPITTAVALVGAATAEQLPDAIDGLDFNNSETRSGLEFLAASPDNRTRRNAEISLAHVPQYLDRAVNAVIDSEPRELPSLARALAHRSETALERLRQLAQAPPRPRSETPDRDSIESTILDRRQAAAAAGLFHVHPEGSDEFVRTNLPFQPDPQVRSYLIHTLARSINDPEQITGWLDRENDRAVRQALLLVIADIPIEAWTDDQRQAAVQFVEHIHRDDPDACIHAAARWALQHWDNLAKVNPGLPPEPLPAIKAWRRGPLGITLVRVHDAPHGPIEVSDTEITVLSFITEFPKFETRSQKIAAADEPIAEVNWIEAARFCNRLSAREGLPPDHWCYIESADGSTVQIAPDHRARIGYRLPSLDEFARLRAANTTTRRYFGDADDLLREYVWYLENASEPQPVARLKPTSDGLFDILGNLSELCEYPSPGDPDYQAIGGDSFMALPRGVTSMPTAIYRNSIEGKFHNTGFRVVRTLP